MRNTFYFCKMNASLVFKCCIYAIFCIVFKVFCFFFQCNVVSMFAKLKKKIQEESQNVTGSSEEKKSKPHVSGIATEVASPGPGVSGSHPSVTIPHSNMSPRSGVTSPGVSSPGPGLASPVNKDMQGRICIR